jgi:hypothetical protein
VGEEAVGVGRRRRELGQRPRVLQKNRLDSGHGDAGVLLFRLHLEQSISELVRRYDQQSAA